MFSGEVSLHRLTWQRVWSLAAPKDKTLVTAMAWRPDGKQLAVAYDSCKFFLYLPFRFGRFWYYFYGT